jgi:hypothetical protein
MKVSVIKPYQRPYDDSISVKTGEPVAVDFDKHTDIAGWVWCIAEDGRSGWTPRSWLVHSGDGWFVNRDFDATDVGLRCAND